MPRHKKQISENKSDINVAIATVSEQLKALSGKMDLSFRSRDEKLDTLISKMDKFCDGTEGRIRGLELSTATAEGKASQRSVYISYALIGLGWIVTAAIRFVK
jgi:hypothetical protein